MMSVAVGRPAARDAPAPRNQAKFCGRAQNTLVNFSWSISLLPSPERALENLGVPAGFRTLSAMSHRNATDFEPAAEHKP